MNIGIQRHFDAAHLLPNYNGKCANLHGHTYTVKVTVAGVPDENTGMVMDFNILKDTVDRCINKLDHQYLNTFIPNPTAEKIVEYLLHTMLRDLKFKDMLFEYLIVRVYESPESWAEDTINYGE